MNDCESFDISKPISLFPRSNVGSERRSTITHLTNIVYFPEFGETKCKRSIGRNDTDRKPEPEPEQERTDQTTHNSQETCSLLLCVVNERHVPVQLVGHHTALKKLRVLTSLGLFVVVVFGVPVSRKGPSMECPLLVKPPIRGITI